MAKSKNEDPNAGLDIEEFDYMNLKGESFKKYQEVIKSLQYSKKYDFEVWLATADLKYGLDENTGEKYQFMNGITLNGAKAIEVTRISALQAQELNKHVTHLNGSEHRGTSKYLLLKKPSKQVAEVTQ